MAAALGDEEQRLEDREGGGHDGAGDDVPRQRRAERLAGHGGERRAEDVTAAVAEVDRGVGKIEEEEADAGRAERERDLRDEFLRSAEGTEIVEQAEDAEEGRHDEDVAGERTDHQRRGGDGSEDRHAAEVGDGARVRLHERVRRVDEAAAHRDGAREPRGRPARSPP